MGDARRNFSKWFKYSNWMKPGGQVTKTLMAQPLTHRQNATLANFDDKYVFILGGTFTTISTVDYYNISENVWTIGPMMKYDRQNFSCCILAGVLYAFNGQSMAFDVIESLDVQSLLDG